MVIRAADDRNDGFLSDPATGGRSCAARGRVSRWGQESGQGPGRGAAGARGRVFVAFDGAAWRFTDDRGVTAAAGSRPLRIAAYVRAGAALWDLGVRPVAVYGSGHDGAELDPAKAGGLAAVPVRYAGAGDVLDEAALRDARPDLVVDVTYDGERPYALPEAVAGRLGVPLVALAVDGAQPLGSVLARFAELAGSLGAQVPVPGADLATAESAVRAAAGTGPGRLRVLALSAAGPDTVHLARPGTWPDLHRLARLGVDLIEPPAGGGVNWLTADAERAASLGADLVLADCRGSAVQPHDLARVSAWRTLTDRAAVEPWNPEIPCSEAACTAFFGRVAEALELLGSKRPAPGSTEPADPPE